MASDGAAALRAERTLLALAYRNLNPMLMVTTVAALGTAIVLSQNGYDWAWLWLACVIAPTPLRFWHGRRFLRAEATGEQQIRLQSWRTRFALGVHFSALLWLIPSFTAAQSPSTAQYTLAIVMSALAAGGTGIMAPLRLQGRVYITLMLGPTSLLLWSMPAGGPILVALGFVFLAAMLVVHERNHMVLRRAVTLQIENDTLVEDLRSLNGKLEQKVVQRTEDLKQAAYRDNLTGLPNRRGLTDWMQANLRGDAEDEAAILFLDLDRFKQVNDAMGHDIGDQVLRATAQRLAEGTPDCGILARWGGDEFVLVLGHGSDMRARAPLLGQQLVDTINFPFEAEGQSLSLGLSVGLAFYPTDAADPNSAILAADLAVAEVKRAGRGQVFAYSQSYAETQRRRFDLGRALTTAISSDLLDLHYQPIVCAKTGEIHAYEALLRWQDSVFGKICPEEFVAIAEDTDRIVALGDWVLRRACSQAVTWSSVGRTAPPKVCVNVSVKQLLQPDYPLRVMQTLTQCGLPPGRLELEVTESVFAEEHLQITMDAVSNLRALGVSLAIDDFGMGYSSLSRLHSFPVGSVKIDRSFVAEIEGRGGVIIEGTVLLARRLNMTVVAEGVETAAQAEALRALGIEYLQGFYFGAPASDIVAATTTPAAPPRTRQAG